MGVRSFRDADKSLRKINRGSLNFLHFPSKGPIAIFDIVPNAQCEFPWFYDIQIMIWKNNEPDPPFQIEA